MFGCTQILARALRRCRRKFYRDAEIIVGLPGCVQIEFCKFDFVQLVVGKIKQRLPLDGIIRRFELVAIFEDEDGGGAAGVGIIRGLSRCWLRIGTVLGRVVFGRFLFFARRWREWASFAGIEIVFAIAFIAALCCQGILSAAVVGFAQGVRVGLAGIVRNSLVCRRLRVVISIASERVGGDEDRYGDKIASSTASSAAETHAETLGIGKESVTALHRRWGIYAGWGTMCCPGRSGR